jgi:hypothetical protein
MSFAESLEMSIAEGINILIALLMAGAPLADYSKAIAVYRERRLHPKYSTLGAGASEGDYRNESHQMSLTAALKAVTKPSEKYSVGVSLPEHDAPHLDAREYRDSSPQVVPESTVERPIPPEGFLGRPRTLGHIEDQAEADRLLDCWDAASRGGSVAQLRTLAKWLTDLYKPYQPKVLQPQVAPVGERRPEKASAVGGVFAGKSASDFFTTAGVTPSRRFSGHSEASLAPQELSLSQSEALGLQQAFVGVSSPQTARAVGEVFVDKLTPGSAATALVTPPRSRSVASTTSSVPQEFSLAELLSRSAEGAVPARQSPSGDGRFSEASCVFGDIAGLSSPLRRFSLNEVTPPRASGATDVPQQS